MRVPPLCLQSPTRGGPALLLLASVVLFATDAGAVFDRELAGEIASGEYHSRAAAVAGLPGGVQLP